MCKFDVETIPVVELSREDYHKCYRLNARHNGQMQSTIARARRGDYKYAKASLVKENDILIGWALHYKTAHCKQPDAHFYVRLSHRKQGIGKILMDEVLSGVSKIRVYPHNKASAVFFSQYRTSVVTSRYSRTMLDYGEIYRQTGQWRY